MTPFNRLVLRSAQPDRNTGNIELRRPEFAKASRACGHEVMSYCYSRDCTLKTALLWTTGRTLGSKNV
jgi:hypothetical protein